MTYSGADLHLPLGSCPDGADPVVVTPESARWAYSGLRVLRLAPGEARVIETGEHEMAVLPLKGGCTVEAEGRRFELEGRESVFARVSDFAYVPMGAELRIASTGGGEFALATAKATRKMAPAYGPAEEVEVSVRGAGAASRQITDFLMAGVGMADKLLAVEVITPAGNFSSFPPHKHDTWDPEAPEAELEEIYYFEFSGEGGYGLFHQWKEGEFAMTEVVRPGDVVLCPYGYHGPTAAVPGHHMFFLNVMAGPGDERVWHATDDPAQAWARRAWEGGDQDGRLPMTSHEGIVGG